MSYDSDLRAKALQIYQKCVHYQEVLEKGGNQITPEQRQEMAQWPQIPYLFEPFAQLPDPDAGVLANMLTDLRSAMAELSDGQILPAGKEDKHGETVNPVGDFSHMNVNTDFTGWTGSAAQNFVSNFINPFPVKVQSQFVAVYVLASAIKGYQAVWRNARADAMKIADKTLEALEHHCHFGGGAAMTLTVISAVAAVGTALVEGPVVPAVLVLEVVSAAGGVGGAAAGAGGDKQELDLSGGDAFSIVPKLRAALDKLRVAINQKQDDVYGVISKDFNNLQANTDKLIPAKPELATATKSNVKGMFGNAG